MLFSKGKIIEGQEGGMNALFIYFFLPIKSIRISIFIHERKKEEQRKITKSQSDVAMGT